MCIRIPLSRIIEKVDSLFNKNDYLEAGKLLEYWLKEASALKDRQGELSILNELIGYYRKVKNEAKALESINKALLLLDVLEQKGSITGGAVLLNCATAFKAFEKSDKALPLYLEAENIYKNLLDSNDERFGGLYNNFALALVDLNEFDKAIDYYYKAIAVMQKIDNGKQDLAITYVNLAHLFDQKGDKREKSVDCLFKAYELLNDDSIIKNGYFAYVLSKCAPSFKYFGFDKIATELETLSKEIYERS